MPLLENLANYRICHAKGCFFFFTWGWVQQNHAIAKHLILTQQLHNSNWPQRVTRGALEDCLQFSSFCFMGSGFCQYGERELHGSGTQLCPSSSFNRSPWKQSLMSLKCFFWKEELLCFFSISCKAQTCWWKSTKGNCSPASREGAWWVKEGGGKGKNFMIIICLLYK